MEALRKLETFRNQRKMISTDLKTYARKQENELLIPTKGLQKSPKKKQLNILEKGINVLCTKSPKKYWLVTEKKEVVLKDGIFALEKNEKVGKYDMYKAGFRDLVLCRRYR